MVRLGRLTPPAATEGDCAPSERQTERPHRGVEPRRVNQNLQKNILQNQMAPGGCGVVQPAFGPANHVKT